MRLSPEIHRRIPACFILITAVSVHALTAQVTTTSSGSVADGAQKITGEDVRRHVAAIAADSVGARVLRSRGLELTAQYVAAQFKVLGLLPGDSILSRASASANTQGPQWTQRYPLPGNLTLSYSQSLLTVTARPYWRDHTVVSNDGVPIERSTQLSFTTSVRFASDTVPESGGVDPWSQGIQAKLVVLTGRHTAATIRAAGLREANLLYVPPAGTDTAECRRVLETLGRSSNILIVGNEDSATFARRRATAEARPPVIMNRSMERTSGVRHWAAYVWPDAIADLLALAGFDLAKARADTVPMVRSIPDIGFTLSLSPYGSLRDTATAMNTIALLPGADSVLRNEYVVFSAHMDQADTVSADGRSRLGNGADDNASGVAGLLALAKAFRQPGAQPRRSLLFIATSGISAGAAGANYVLFSEVIGLGERALLDITLDMVGGAPKDSLIVDGLQDITFESPPNWTAAQHPELGLTLVDGGTVATTSSDQVAFVARAIPTLLFHDRSRGGRDAADRPETVDMDQATRRLRMIYYIARDVANAAQRPRWTAVGREQRLKLLGQ